MILAGLMGSVAASGSATTPTYTLLPFFSGGPESINEGGILNFKVGGTNVPDGTYYWTIETNAGDFATTSGTVSVSGNTGPYLGNFNVAPTADATTEGAETFTVALRSGSITGPIIVTSAAVTINDTSLTPVPPFSLNFPAGNPYLLVSNTQADWNLGTTYTIEYWSKGGNASNGAIRTVMTQTNGSGNIDLGYAYTHLLFNGTEPIYPEPTPGAWAHVAWVRESGSGYVNVYYNGVYQTNFNAGPALANGGSDLYIGKRGSGVSGQGFYGKLAMLRISNTAKYLDNFSPSLSYGVEADTRLMLGSDNPLTDLTLYELNGITTSGNNGGTIYFSKATYPDLNNQIRTGDTVVKVSDSTTSTVTGAVFTPNGDPDNWGVPVSPGWGGVSTVNFSGPGRHPVSVQGAVAVSTDFPHILVGIHNAESGGNLGAAYIHFGDPNVTAFSAIPIGASITSNLSGFGIRLVTGNSPYYGGQMITYDNTGLPGGTVSTTSDTYNFYW